jgi:ankyrin repeat protein
MTIDEAKLDEHLLVASEKGDVEAVKDLLQQGANPNALGSDGKRPLHRAAASNRLEVIAILLDAGADIESPAGGRTPLMEAIMRGAVEAVAVLLDKGADLEARDDLLGATPLILAAGGRTRAIPLLLKREADATASDNNWKTSLMWLVDVQFHRGGVPHELIKLLVDAGAPINAQDKQGRSALIWAVVGDSAFEVRPAVLKALLDKGADVGLKNSFGETALFVMVRTIDNVLDLQNGKKCLELLLAAGADPTDRNNDGKTPLGVVDPRNPAVIDFLKNMGFRE